MLRAVLVALTALLFSLVAPRSAFAQRVLLVQPPPGDAAISEAFNRLRAELLLQEFEVVVLDPQDRRLTPDELELEAQRADAFAAVALNRHHRGTDADVSIADRVTGKISLRRLAISAGQDSPRILAVRAVDLLRASLRELPPDERPPPDVVGVTAKPPPPAELRAFAKPSKFLIGASATVLGAAHDVSSGYGASLTFWVQATSRLKLGVLLVGPLLGARYRSANGDAVVRQELGQLRATFNVLPPGRLELGPVLGAGIYHLQAQGDVTTPLSSRSAQVFTFAGSGGVEALLPLTEALSVGASFSALLLTPRPVLAVEAASAELGQPLLLASLGLGVAF